MSEKMLPEKMRALRRAAHHLTLCSLSLAVAVLLSACGQEIYSDSSAKQLKPDAVGWADAAGQDFRVYEFTPQTASGKQCIFVAATGKGGLFCFDKALAEAAK